MLIIGNNNGIEVAVNFAYVMEIYRAEECIYVTYHTGTFEEIFNTVSDVKTVLFAEYADSEQATRVLETFYRALTAGAKVFSFNEVDTDCIF